ncbi:MAG: sugar kinase [Candidatus Schekmanbacteria bacterium]|nr:sugar kinase [Candidatus Schekmanbacteria bacterium]
MSLLVVGSVAFDSVKTPFGEAHEVLGGSATYFSVAASYFTDVLLVAVVGEDFDHKTADVFKNRPIDIRGLQTMPGKTFRWRGEYSFDLNEARTLETCLNVLADFKPQLPADYCDCDIVFLANIDPELQSYVLDQVKKPRLVACDTMNFWIENRLEALKTTLKRIDLLVINEGEARELAKEPNLVKAANKIMAMGPSSLIIKRGEYGALMFSAAGIFAVPGFPLEFVFDPTGAGDSFAGGLMGHLSRSQVHNDEVIRQAMIFASVMASYNVESFSLDRLRNLTYADIESRFAEFKKLTHFETL